MFTVFKKWPRISKLVLKSILLSTWFIVGSSLIGTVIIPAHSRVSVSPTSTGPGTRMSVEGYLELLKMYWFIWVSCHLTLSLGWGADAWSSKEFALRGIGEFLGVLNRVIIPEMQRKTVKSYIAPWKGIQDILCQWNLDSGFQSLVGLQILWAVVWILKPRIPDSRCQSFRDSGFHKHKFPGFQDHDFLTWCDI